MYTPHKQAVLFHLLLFFLFLLACQANDMIALLSFKSTIYQDPHQALSSWNHTSLNYCNWRGVKCSLRHSSKVTELNLDAFNITGTLPPSISNLTFLQSLNLPNNHLYGQIPPELGHLRRLRFLNLSGNSLTGEIPSTLSHCSQLQVINLRSNKLEGELPSNLSNCLNLKIITLKNNFFTGNIPSVYSTLPNLLYLDVGSNNLTGIIPPSLGNITNLFALDLSQNMISGAIPSSLTGLSSLVFLYLNKNSLIGSLSSSIGNISSLQYFDISNNNLTGELPTSLGNLSSLTYFDVTLNSFSGSIPSTLGGLSMLTTLALTANYFSGSIPHSLGSLSSITELVISHNQLSGTIPPSLFNISSLESIGLSDNQFVGGLPEDLGNYLPHLQALTMYYNRLTGPIPSSLANATMLEDIELSGNSITGKIPANLGNLQILNWLALDHNELEAIDDHGWSFMASFQNCSQLQVLQLERNMFGGTLPQSIANLSASLSWLTLGGNQISGSLPEEIGNLVSLVFLTADENHLEGNIPESLGECQSLEILDLSRNRLTGTIPKEILSLEFLSKSLDLSHNLLTGFLPEEVGRLKNLGEFHVGSNNLSGEIPRTIGECEILEILHMESNNFQGEIPQSLKNLKGIRELDVSKNRLSGLIPEFLEDFSSLQYLNLSFNDFEGEVPRKGVFRNASGVSLNGNDRLCGGNPGLNLSSCTLQNKIESHHSPRLKLILSVLISVLALFVSVCLLSFWYWLHNRRKKTSASDFIKDLQPKVSFSDLLKATDGFSPEKLIGAGTFGAVYKGIVDLGEQKVVAIKVLKLEQHGALKSFTVECNALRSIRHRNLIKILSSCSSIDYKGNDFKALIFEYMPNGSLENWLHPKENYQNKEHSLSHIQRLNIAIDVASALDYLHNQTERPIIHCDLKPSNVLLDDDMTAHVGDFGLARFLSTTTSRLSQNSSMSIGIKGTTGYVAPEYGMTNQISTHGDVYSYGILLLEMITAKSPTDESFKDGMSLRMFVQTAFPENVIDITDPILHVGEERGETFDERLKRQESLISILKVGLLCSKESPRERMRIDVAIKELHSIRNKIQTSETRSEKNYKDTQSGEGTSYNSYS